MLNTTPEKLIAKVVLEGLFVFCVNPKKRRAEIGAYEFANEHTFSINIVKKMRKNNRPIGERLLIEPSSSTDHANNISIAVKNRPADLEIFKNSKLSDDIFLVDPADRGDFDPEDNNNVNDFRWVIDLEGPRYHDKKLNITPGMLERKIFIGNGALSTRQIAPRVLKYAFPKAPPISEQFPASEKSPVSERLPVIDNRYVAYQVGVDLISDGEPVVLSYSDATASKANKLRLAAHDDYYYEIHLNNICERPDQSILRFSDFQHYYNVFADTQPADRFDFEPFVDGGANFRSPCDVTFLGQHEELP